MLSVSILVPSYNSKRFLTDCLESALRQSHDLVEIIVVDDGSTDGSLELARTFGARGVHVIAQENRGQPSAINTAFRASSGDYLQYLDADDLLAEKKIESQVARLAQAQRGSIASGAWTRFHTDLTEVEFRAEAVWQDLEPVDWLVRSWSGGGMMHVAGWLVPRQIADMVGPWDESIRWAANLDAHFFTNVLLCSSRCLFCPDAISYYRSGYFSQSALKDPRSLQASLRVCFQCGEALLRREDSKRTRAAFADNLQRFVYSTYPACPDLIRLAEDRINELGGSRLNFSAGPLTAAAAKFVGWRFAKRLRGTANLLEQCKVWGRPV